MTKLSDYTNPTEDMECEALAQWLRLKNIPFTHIANESGRGRTAMLRTAKLKRLGQSPGFPDYLIVIPTPDSYAMETSAEEFCWTEKWLLKRLIAVEMKRKKGGRVSSEQQQWLDTLNSAGIESVVCRGFDEAKKFIEERIK